MNTNTPTDRAGLRSRKIGVVVFAMSGLLGGCSYLDIHRQHTRSTQTRVASPQGQQVGRQTEELQQQEARRKRKALLVQKINRYWQLREEAVERGIDVSRMPVMPFVIGQDGNIYRLLPDGRRQLVPDDEFRDPTPRGV